MRRVVITGVGLITPVGLGTQESWNGLIAGQSGVGPIRHFDPSSLQTQIGAEIIDFEPQKYVANRRALRMMTRGDQFALVAATFAVRDGQLDLALQNSERAGLFVGGNKEISDPMHVLDASLVARNADSTVDIHRFGESARSTVYPLFFVEGLQAGSLFYISQALGLKGANTYFAGKAESGAIAIGRAYRAIRRGEADLALAGGFDDPVSWWNMTKFDSLDVMTDQNQLGATACRPFDKTRTGEVMGEGAAFVLLESYEAALQRDARIYAEITGFGCSYDAYEFLTPHPEGQGMVHAIRAALSEATSNPAAIDYVAAHGSGSTLGDASEARALSTVFGERTDAVAVSSVKPATGHLVAGAGALNIAVAALAMRHQVVPPTLNLEQPDLDGAVLEWVIGQARQRRVNQSLSLAKGAEGQNVALLMRTVS